MTRICIYMLSTVLVVSQALYACFDYRPNGTITCSMSGTINVGESVTFTASNLDCSIVEYEWRLPSAAYGISGANSDQVKCKYSPAGQYTVELLIKCVHNLWNVDPLDTNPETIGRITYTITVAPVSGPWYVSPGGNDNNNGLSNSATGAFRTIQTAIDSAIDGQEIIVESGDSTAPAVYYEQIDVKGKNLSIHSTDPDNWEAVQNTIIDANKQGTAVMFGGTETSLCQLKGFTIRGGFPTEEALALHLTFDSSQESGSDSSGKGRNGILVGAQRTDSGRFGGGINFDGIDDYIQIENYKGVLGRRSRTVSAWIKPEGTGSPTICSWGSIEEGKRWMVTLDGIDGGLSLGVWGGRKHSSVNLRDGRWHHVAVSLDGDSNPNITEAKLYVDGIEDTNAVVDNCIGGREIFTEDGGDVIVGARFEDEVDPDADYCYTGKMDELKIFSRALTHSEIEKLALTPIELHLKLDGTAIDSSGNQYNGTVVGDQSWIGSGRILGALDLDGTGDYVALPSGIINPAETPFSVFLWVRQDEKTVNNPYIVQQANESDDRQGRSWLFRNAVDDRLGTNIGNVVTYSGNPVFTNTGEWIHIGLTYNGQKVTLYVNGQSCGSALRTAGECSGSILIGRHKSENDPDYPNWNGAVDDLRIYKGVIGPDEIQRIFNHEEPVAHWTMDAISGNTISDSSSYNRSGTFNAPSPTSICSGDRIGNAIQLQNNEYIQIADWTGITGGNSRTCSGWIRTSQGNGQIFSWGEVATGKKWIVRVNSTGELRVEVQNGYIVGTKLLTDNKWHHIAVVLDNDGTPDISEVKLYVDGIRETISTVAACAIDTSATNNVQLGAYSPAPLYFNGWLDDMRIYSWPLSQEKIQQIANDMDLVAHWTLDELSGTTSADSSGNDITGTWNGGPVPSVEGFNNGAMEFDGTEDYITTSCVGILGTQDRTVSAWIKAVPQIYTPDEPVLRTIVGWGGTGTGEAWNLAVNYVLNEGPYGTLRLAAGASKVVGTTRIDDNHWHHVAAVFANDGTPKVSDIQLYIDGKKEVISYKVEASLNTGIGNNVTLGAMKYQSNAPMFYFKGKIDEVRVYDRALSEADFWQMYQTSIGGGIAGHGTSALIEQCIIKNNHSSSNGGGVGSYNGKISRCYILDNEATDSGGGLADFGGDIINCVIAQNTAQNGGGLYNCTGKIINCTIADNVAIADNVTTSAGALKDCIGSNSVITNSIIWNNGTNPIVNCSIPSYCCYPDGTGTNINTDPCFNPVDIKGEDEILGTYDDGYAIEYGGTNNSPCIDKGDNTVVVVDQDIVGCERIKDSPDTDTNEIVDIGAYEYRKIVYVDGSVAIDQAGTSWSTPYKYLYSALSSPNGSEIWIADGTYTPQGQTYSFLISGKTLNIYGGFRGKETDFDGETRRQDRNISTYQVILSGKIGNYSCSNVVSFGNTQHSGRGILDGVTVQEGTTGIYVGNSSQATIKSCRIIANNTFGIKGYEGTTAPMFLSVENCIIAKNCMSNPTISYGVYFNKTRAFGVYKFNNCTIYGNMATDKSGYGIYINSAGLSVITNSIIGGHTTDLSGLDDVFYCCTQDGTSYGDKGIGNIEADPLFIGGGDYHLQSKEGRWTGSTWTIDSLNSPCIDAGNAAFDYLNEPMGANGGRINMGAYGNTPEASKSVDYNNDGISDIWQERYWNGQNGVPLFDRDNANTAWAPFTDYNQNGLYNIYDYKLSLDPITIGSSPTTQVITNLTHNIKYLTIQSAIDCARDGDIIELTQGTYPVTESISFKGKRITLRSQDPENPEATVIDLGGSAAIDVFVFNTYETSGSVLEGFTVKGGRYGINCKGVDSSLMSSPTIRKCRIQNNSSYGIQVDLYAGPTIEYCRIKNNATGGVSLAGSGTRPIIQCCEIVNNGQYGIAVTGSSSPFAVIVIKNCVIAGNNTSTSTSSCGIYLPRVNTCNITNCTIADNKDTGESYGIYVESVSGTDTPVVIKNSILWNNGDDLYYKLTTADKVYVSYCCLEDVATETAISYSNIINCNPLFYISEYDHINDLYDYRLQYGSRCLAAGENGVELGAYGGSVQIILDENTDGLADIWQMEYWSGQNGIPLFDKNNQNTAWASATDYDGDGLRNIDEYYLGTNPVVSEAGTGQHYDTIVTNQRIGIRFPSIQMAIDFAEHDDVLVAAEATYPVTESISFKGKRITLRSHDPENPEATVIDLGGSAAIDVFVFNTYETSGSILEGFTFKGGHYGINCKGGDSSLMSSPTIRKCHIQNNSSYGIHVDLYAAPTIEYCQIKNNTTGGVSLAGSGTGPTIQRCEIVNNGQYGIAVTDSSYWPFAVIKNCVIAGNNTSTSTDSCGVYLPQVNTCNITNCTIADNKDTGKSYGIYVESVSGTDTPVVIKNSILWNNGDDLCYELKTADKVYVSYCCIEDMATETTITYDTNTLYHANPLFRDPPGGPDDTGDGNYDYSLRYISPYLKSTEDGLHNLGAYGSMPEETTFTDENNDGIADEWQAKYWNNDNLPVFDSQNPNSSWNPIGDPDGDGLRNIDEFNLEWNPRDGATVFQKFVLRQQSGESDIFYPSLKHAIFYAEDGNVLTACDEEVDGEISNPPLIFDEAIDFLGKAITLQSENPDDPSVVNATIIGSGTASAGSRVAFSTNETSSSILAGFTIRTKEYGVYCGSGTAPVIRSCIIENNTIAGIYILGAPTIEKCVMRNNTNSAGSEGKGVSISGSNASPSITECEIINNIKYGVYAESDSSLSLRNCVIANNDNTSTNYSYGIDMYDIREIHVVNCTIVGHTKTQSRGVRIRSLEPSAVVEIKNNIVWGNTTNIEAPSGISVSYCCIGGYSGGIGNISSDPLFANPAPQPGEQYDYHLKSHYGRYSSGTWVQDTNVYSPCIDAGAPGDDYFQEVDMPAGTNGGRINMGAYGNTPQASKSADSDNDGISDVWEKIWWPGDEVGSHNPGDDNGVHENSGNGDGFTNEIEYYFNYNPKDNTVKGVEFANVKPSTLSFDPTKGETFILDFWLNKSARLKFRDTASDDIYFDSQSEMIPGHHQIIWDGKSLNDNLIILDASYNWLLETFDGSSGIGSATWTFDDLKPVNIHYNHKITNLYCNPNRIIPVFNEIAKISYQTSLGDIASWPMTITIYDPDGNEFTKVIDNTARLASVINDDVWNGKKGEDNCPSSRYASTNGKYVVEVRFSDMREKSSTTINVYR